MSRLKVPSVGKPTVLAIESGEMQTTSAGAEDFMGENAD